MIIVFTIRDTSVRCCSAAAFVILLLEQDVVFIIRKNGSVEGRTTLEAGPQAKGPPLTLLVDKGTASAAEVFAAAVRYGSKMRGTLICSQLCCVCWPHTELEPCKP